MAAVFTDYLMTQLNSFFFFFLTGPHTLDYGLMFGVNLCVFLIVDMPDEIKPENCESKEQRTETASHSQGIGKQATDQPQQKELTSHTNIGSATNSNVSTPKSQNRTGRKPRVKK